MTRVARRRLRYGCACSCASRGEARNTCPRPRAARQPDQTPAAAGRSPTLPTPADFRRRALSRFQQNTTRLLAVLTETGRTDCSVSAGERCRGLCRVQSRRALSGCLRRWKPTTSSRARKEASTPSEPHTEAATSPAATETHELRPPARAPTFYRGLTLRSLTSDTTTGERACLARRSRVAF